MTFFSSGRQFSGFVVYNYDDSKFGSDTILELSWIQPDCILLSTEGYYSQENVESIDELCLSRVFAVGAVLHSRPVANSAHVAAKK